MKASALLDGFDLAIDSDGSIPLLRKLIVGLAVQGRLVEEIDREETAARAVEEIAAAQSREGRNARRLESFRPISPEEIPGGLAGSCRFERLARVAILKKTPRMQRGGLRAWLESVKARTFATVGFAAWACGAGCFAAWRAKDSDAGIRWAGQWLSGAFGAVGVVFVSLAVFVVVNRWFGSEKFVVHDLPRGKRILEGVAHIKGQSFSLSDVLPDGVSLLQDRVFEDCVLKGPAVVQMKDGTILNGCQLEAEGFIRVVAKQKMVLGTVALLRCTFLRCRFQNIAFLGLNADIDRMISVVHFPKPL